MLALLSPAKKQDFTEKAPLSLHTKPICEKQVATLVGIMQKLDATDIADLMTLSKTLAELNYQRYQTYDLKHYTEQNAKQAIYAFNGDVYQGLEADTLSKKDIAFAQKHIAILSGLYGILRPLDYIQPHRLEMGTPLVNPKGKNLYDFWQATLPSILEKLLDESGSRVLINLASNEYFKAVDTEKITADIIHVDFKEYKNSKYSTIGLFAKRARGMMAHFIIQGEITKSEELKQFNTDGYQFNTELSSKTNYVFTRGK